MARARKVVVPELVKGLAQESKAPPTWEEIIALCSVEGQRAGIPFHMLIETQTFDTYVNTLHEVVWSCGGDLHIHSDYSFSDFQGTYYGLFRALTLLGVMFDRGIIPRNCSLEPSEMQARFTHRAAGTSEGEWLFARHWYSTFVDILTAHNEKGYVWQPGEMDLEVMPIPVSLSQYLERGEDVTHASCWGEWHLAVLKGTENKALAMNLINNLASSQKICTGAFSHAAVPTVQAFYDQYGDIPCLEVPERRDVGSLPRITFNELKKDYMGPARSRCEVFDYRHCMREVHAVLELVAHAPDLEPTKLAARVYDAMKRIEALVEQGTLTH